MFESTRRQLLLLKVAAMSRGVLEWDLSHLNCRVGVVGRAVYAEQHSESPPRAFHHTEMHFTRTCLSQDTENGLRETTSEVSNSARAFPLACYA